MSEAEPARLFQRLRNRLRALGAAVFETEDSPQRVAAGVALGVFIGFTPTLGLQTVIYVVLAALLPVNKLAGFPAIFISNPLTAVPLYYAAWRLGDLVLHTLDPAWGSTQETMSWDSFASSDLTAKLFDIGIELWLGCILAGAAFALAAYVITLRVVHQRRRQA